MQKDLDEKGGMGRMKPIGKFFRETRGRTENQGLRQIAKQKATDDRWLSVRYKKNPLMTVHQRVCRFRTILIRVTERTGR